MCAVIQHGSALCAAVCAVMCTVLYSSQCTNLCTVVRANLCTNPCSVLYTGPYTVVYADPCAIMCTIRVPCCILLFVLSCVHLCAPPHEVVCYFVYWSVYRFEYYIVC
jgi:hypothetical protein